MLEEHLLQDIVGAILDGYTTEQMPIASGLFNVINIYEKTTF
jgi:hypothetical protein